MDGWRMPAFLFVIRGPGGDILDVDGRGACATSASVEDFAAKSAHATWFQVYTTGTVRVRSNRGVATKKAVQP